MLAVDPEHRVEDERDIELLEPHTAVDAEWMGPEICPKVDTGVPVALNLRLDRDRLGVGRLQRETHPDHSHRNHSPHHPRVIGASSNFEWLARSGESAAEKRAHF